MHLIAYNNIQQNVSFSYFCQIQCVCFTFFLLALFGIRGGMIYFGEELKCVHLHFLYPLKTTLPNKTRVEDDDYACFLSKGDLHYDTNNNNHSKSKKQIWANYQIFTNLTFFYCTSYKFYLVWIQKRDNLKNFEVYCA